MRKIKKISFIVISTLVLSSCGRYSKVLNKGTAEERYKLATELYDAGKYNKAVDLFEKVITPYQGKPQMERIQYMVAQSYFNLKDYILSSYYFDKFAKNFPTSSKKEEAMYMSAYSDYLASPKYSLDQSDTEKAITKMQVFIDSYPNSDRIADANKISKELRHKLEKKSFEIAKQYYKLEDYKAAIVSFDNFLSDNLGSSFKEEVLFLRLKASHDLAMESVQKKKGERLNDAVKAFEKLERAFSDSQYLEEAKKLLIKINKELDLITQLENK
ncbi:outer membrane protein assembly factor BamD [Aureivirga sp. CE67]|uniref:outer membrane protein assembly factor BamD n=1 Tax=Aureivirga sp. CE67 TaxID=1788983 RepID=UPI0018C9191F|nr:outer membrane protein assembly factor BamD [Aureivirga sp. CE67]